MYVDAHATRRQERETSQLPRHTQKEPKYEKITLYTLALLSTLNCAQANSSSETAEVMSEPLYGISIQQQLTIQVNSNGFTRAEHFKTDISQDEDLPQLRILRTKSDRCRAMPRVIDITLPLPDELNGQFQLWNPLMASTN